MTARLFAILVVIAAIVGVLVAVWLFGLVSGG